MGLAFDSAGYLEGYEANLRRALSDSHLEEFRRGSGGELTGKMRALHSSSALVANVFAHFSAADTSLLQYALRLDSAIASVGFEQQFPTGLVGKPPNLDVVLKLRSGRLIAIESKFSEWLVSKSRNKVCFDEKYFPASTTQWTRQGLPLCQALAGSIRDRRAHFKYLDAPQLLKHALGLAVSGAPFNLIYLFYDGVGAASSLHGSEIRRFSELVGPELRFAALSYQDLLRDLRAAGVDRDYLSYLERRYFPEDL